MAESIEKVNRPPMGADVSACQNLPSSTNPGKITFFNVGINGQQKFWPLYQINPDIAAIGKYIEGLQERIAKTAKNDIFRFMQNLREQTKSDLSTVEIDTLKEEAFAQLGPVIGRVYGTMRQPSAPPPLDHAPARAHSRPSRRRRSGSVPLKIDFISILTMAQKA